MKARTRLHQLLLPALLLSSSHLDASTLTWNGTAGGNWNTAGTWLDGVTPATWNSVTPDSAIFGSTGVGTVNLTVGTTAAGLTFNTAGYTISGNTLTLSGAARVITTNADATINSTLASAGATGTTVLTKEGTGRLTLGTTPTYTGDTLINAGTLQYVYTSGVVSATTISANGSLTLTATGLVVGSASFNLSGNGALNIGNTTNSRLIMQGSSSGFTGNISVAANGILEPRKKFTATSGNNIEVLGTLRLWDIDGGPSTFGALTGNGQIITVTGDAVKSTLNIGKSGTDGNFSGTISNSIANTTISLIKTGTGTQTLSGANTYTGTTNLNGGMLKAGAINTFSSGSAITLANTSGVSLNLDGFNQTVGSIAGGGATGGNIALGSGTLTSGGNNSTTSFDGVISGTGGSMVKTGTGSLTLSRASNYTGGTTISKGTLALTNTSAAGSGAITLNDASTDSNNTTLTLAAGTYANAITVANQGMGTSTISTTSTSGSISLNGGLTLNKASIFSATGGLGDWMTLESMGTLFSGAGTLTINNTSGSGRALILNTGSTTGFTGDVIVNSNATVEARNRLNPDGITKVAGNNMQVNGWLYLMGDSGSTTINALTGSGNIGTRWNGQSTLTIGQGDGVGTFSGVIQNGTPMGNTGTALTKNGSGTQIFSGANTYSGTTTIKQGTLKLDGAGSLANSATITVGDTTGSSAQLDVSSKTGGFTVGASQTLKGSGSVIGGISVSGVLAPGNSIESLKTGDLSLLTGSTYQYELNKDAAANVAGDLTAITGNLSLNGTVNLSFVQTGSGLWELGTPLGDHFGSPAADKLTLISYTGTWNGGLFTYGGNTIADDSAIVISGQQWWFNYNDNDAGTNFMGDLGGATRFVTMTVPEPGAALLGGLGLLALLRRRRG